MPSGLFSGRRFERANRRPTDYGVRPLAVVRSPVVNRMLSMEMKEKRERTLNLHGLGIEMEHKKNVVNLLKLADYFQVDWLKEQCEAHLIHCVEIPAIERFQLIERYRLNKLKHNFMRRFNCTNLREFSKQISAN
ncbi:hypothetical protein GPALN_003086 [Globodera pallida]|nr:hypothetical protein GPALN_003086 [Globodera pallida]